MLKRFLWLSMWAMAVQADVMLPADEPSRWQASPDGGDAPSVTAAEPYQGRTALRFAYANRKGYGNSMLEPVSVPPEAYGVRFSLFVERAASASAMHLWFREKDGDMWMCPVTPEDGKRIGEVTGAWRSVFIPLNLLKHQPRGDTKRHFLSSDRMMIGFNFGDQTVRIAGLTFVVRPAGTVPDRVETPVSHSAEPRGRRIALLHEPGAVRQPGHPDPVRLARLLREAGFSPVMLSASGLHQKQAFSRDSVDLLVLPNAPFFPLAAVDAFREYLKQGGAFLSIGGYAFDTLRSFDGTAWSAQPLWPLAKELDSIRRAAERLNTRYGDPGDTMRLHPEQLGVFDPSFLLRNVASVRAADDQFVLPAAWRAELAPEGPAAVAMTGNNNPVFPDVNARWIPLLQTEDRLGRQRGPAAALVLNHRGPFAGSNWGLFGVTNLDLFNGEFPALDRLFVDVCRRLLAPSFLIRVQSDFACYRAGETVVLSALARTNGAAAASVRFLVDGATVADVPLVDGAARATWRVPQTVPDFREVCAELRLGGRPVDVMRSGFAVWNPARAVEGPRVSLRGNYFDFNGRPLFFGGVNTTGMMWYSDNEDPLVWRRDFERMGDFAMNTLRILHFSPFCKTNAPQKIGTSLDLRQQPEKTCRQTDAIVQLAQPNQVSLFLSLHDWFALDLTDEELAAQQAWNRFWAARYAAFPGMLYDIQNEPGTRLTQAAVLRPLYEAWLSEHYGSMERARSAWRASGAKPEIDFSAKASGWNDLRVRDNERFRAWVYARWQRENGKAVKQAAPHAPVTVGHLQDLTASEKVLDTTGIDFLNIHHYGAVDHLRGVLKMIDRRFEGKSFSLGEFGSRTAHAARNQGVWGDPAEASVQHYLAVGHYAVGMGASFIANWSWKDFRDCVFPWGINHADLTPKPVLEAYRNMMLLFRTAEPRYEAPALYLLLPDSFRLGPETGRIHEGLRRATDWLLSLNVPFGVLNEGSLDRLPPEARALVWPLAVCPSDASFERVQRFVGQGGRVLLTGDPRFAEDRTPTRMVRLEQLGLGAPAAAVPPFSVKALPQTLSIRLSRDGRVAWVPEPLELLDDRGETGRALYRRFLDETAGVERLRVTPDDGHALVFEVALRDGRAVAAVNQSEETRHLVIPARGRLPEIRAGVAAGRTLYVQINAQGEVVAAAAQQGLTVGGAEVLKAGGDWAVLSLSGEDVRRATCVAAFPFGEGEIGLCRDAGAPALAGEVGEFRAGVWTRLEEQALQMQAGVICGEADAATAYDVRLLSLPARVAETRTTIEHLLRVRSLKAP